LVENVSSNGVIAGLCSGRIYLCAFVDAGRRQGAVMAGETKNKDTALGQFELPLGWEMVYRHRVGVSDSLP